MWDDDCDTIPASINKTAGNGFESSGNGFYVGRGRGFGSMGKMTASLPEVGAQPNGSNDDAWDDGEDVNSFQTQKKSSGWEDDWDDKPVSVNSSSNNNNSDWQSKGRSFNMSNDSHQNRSSKCYNCNEDGHMSKDCPNKDSRGGRSRGCFNCGESGHMSRDCPTKDSRGSGRGGDRNCYNCGESGHMSKDCPTKDSRGSGRGGDRNCYNCGESGHMSKDCPTKDSRGSGRGGDRNCYNCGESGHMSKDCPTKDSDGRCYKCNGKGHLAKDCTDESSLNGNRNGGGKNCYKCNKEGHISRDCPEVGGGGGSKGSGCFKCHEDGHMARDCPKEAVGEDGKPRPPPYIPPEPTEDAQTLFEGVPTGINFAKYDDIHVDVTGTNAPPPIDSFDSSGLCQHLLKNIRQSKYTKPTPVQKYAIPIILKKRDLMACAQTGSGKTAAFLLPILNDMIPNPDLPNNANLETQQPWAVIIAPTRELVIQIGSEARKFAYDSVVKADILYGGTSTNYQSNRIRRGCHLLVATPGRLLDFLEKGKVSFSQLRYFVLDEADRMLDMGFMPNIRKMVEHESMPEKGVRQTLMFSATFPEDIQRLAAEFLDNYLFLTVGMVGAANADVEQTFFNVGQFDKRQKLLEILKDSGTDRTLVFVELKRTADFIASLCSQNNIPTTSIHGDRLQREREEALRDFRSGKMPVLVATAVAARGLDIKDVRHVINYDLPKTIDEYVHRIGRTGRVGNLGKATSFYDSSNDQPLSRSLKKILLDAHQEVPHWLSEDANQAVGTSVQYGGRGNFGARDVRNTGRSKHIDSNDAFDNLPVQQSAASTFNEPVADDEEWG